MKRPSTRRSQAKKGQNTIFTDSKISRTLYFSVSHERIWTCGPEEYVFPPEVEDEVGYIKLRQTLIPGEASLATQNEAIIAYYMQIAGELKGDLPGLTRERLLSNSVKGPWNLQLRDMQTDETRTLLVSARKLGESTGSNSSRRLTIDQLADITVHLSVTLDVHRFLH
eukprot:6192486-Pleurochrysis_carterae.AAC.1